MKKINLTISKYGVWIFVCAALYKFTFWIIDMVKNFKWGGASGVYTLFSGLFEMVISLVILAVILEVSRKIAEKYTPADFAPPAPKPNYNPYNAQPQAPVQPQMQVPPQASVPPQTSVPTFVPPQAPPAPPQTPPAPPQDITPPPVVPPAPDPGSSGVWFCSGCGTQNDASSLFCANCGKPK